MRRTQMTMKIKTTMNWMYACLFLVGCGVVARAQDAKPAATPQAAAPQDKAPAAAAPAGQRVGV